MSSASAATISMAFGSAECFRKNFRSARCHWASRESDWGERFIVVRYWFVGYRCCGIVIEIPFRVQLSKQERFVNGAKFTNIRVKSRQVLCRFQDNIFGKILLIQIVHPEDDGMEPSAASRRGYRCQEPRIFSLSFLERVCCHVISDVLELHDALTIPVLDFFQTVFDTLVS